MIFLSCCKYCFGKKEMIAQLQKMDPNAEVKMHHYSGNNALFVVSVINKPELKNIVFIKDKTDCDLREELRARFEYAAKVQMGELDFFIDLLETGITLEDIKEFYPEKYDYAKGYLEDHGLI